MKCLVINLDRSPDRLAHMRSEFERLNVTFDRFPAVDGAQLSAASIDQINARNQWIRPLTKTEAGCLLSHQACWEALTTDNEPYGAIFEDDVLISPQARTLLVSSDWIPRGADFIKLETRNRAVVVGRAAQHVPGGYRVARLFSFHDGLGGYILSRQCARRLCAQVQQRTAPVDQLILNPRFGIFAGLNVFQLTPAICIPSQIARSNGTALPEISSTIDPNGDLYRTDQSLLQQSGSPNQGPMRREMARMVASLQRTLRRQKRIRIAFR